MPMSDSPHVFFEAEHVAVGQRTLNDLRDLEALAAEVAIGDRENHPGHDRNDAGHFPTHPHVGVEAEDFLSALERDRSEFTGTFVSPVETGVAGP
jgi:hypothetical protein